jgi:hypothetical protein
MTVLDKSKAEQSFNVFAKNKVPMIGFCNPELRSLDYNGCEIVIPLSTATKNHVDSLYFGALAVGADITAGFLAICLSQQSEHYVELVFKDFKADFKKRALADTHFYCEQGELIRSMIAETIETKERVSQPIRVIAKTPTLMDDVVAEFELTLSLKCKPAVA